ncbi:universal stress protein [Roseovarius sp. A21]|uniref:Universal stress protein n=1 Tax=Roseovarius bejariae TaxID=2576383 RepID=A0A844D117_9RHOB|nr:universal stress protein [Roseovarius bejariae]MRU14868.1 universal stress protein [Roseovarius bejariae]
MYSKIIVGLSLDHGISETAIGVARKLADDGAEIIAVHVYEQPNSSVRAYMDDDLLEGAQKNAKARLEDRVKGEEGVKAVLLNGHSGRAITDYAKKVGADCIVVGSHKPELSDFLLGSTAARVVRHASCAVHVLR